MLLQSIRLENFRQFRDESIDFADGRDGKNVTIIIGENGTGKTTFAQAFFWCIGGSSSFPDRGAGTCIRVWVNPDQGWQNNVKKEKCTL